MRKWKSQIGGVTHKMRITVIVAIIVASAGCDGKGVESQMSFAEAAAARAPVRWIAHNYSCVVPFEKATLPECASPQSRLALKPTNLASGRPSRVR